MSIFNRKPKPENINDLANSHMVAALNASAQEESELDKGTVAGRHMPYIKMKHLTISRSLDAMIEASEKARQG